MAHFTYKESPDYARLCQGDVLRKSEDLQALLEKIHPHYLKEDYLSFIVLTQSCELRHKKTPYITIAAVRPLELVIDRKIRQFQSSDDIVLKGKFVDSTVKVQLLQFLKRLLNNNEPDYFYLNDDVEMNLAEPCVAFLALSIALKLDLHYEKCLKAKVLELNDNFKSKLGWLVGNMYSKVGTDDWSDHKPEDEIQKKIESLIRTNCCLIDNMKVFLSEVRKKYSDDQLKAMSEADLQKLKDEVKISTKKERFLGRLTEICDSSDFTIAEAKNKLINQIRNDSDIASLFK